MVQQTTLPNLATYADPGIKKWEDAGLKIKPLALILEILELLGEVHGAENSYLNTSELIKIVIPLSGMKAAPEEIAIKLIEYRRGRLDISQWPDCAPAAKD